MVHTFRPRRMLAILAFYTVLCDLDQSFGVEATFRGAKPKAIPSLANEFSDIKGAGEVVVIIKCSSCTCVLLSSSLFCSQSLPSCSSRAIWKFDSVVDLYLIVTYEDQLHARSRSTAKYQDFKNGKDAQKDKVRPPSLVGEEEAAGEVRRKT